MKLSRTFTATPTTNAPESGFAFDQTVTIPSGAPASASIASYTAGPTPAGQGAVLIVNRGMDINVAWWSSAAPVPKTFQPSFIVQAGQAKVIPLPYANGAATYDTLLFLAAGGLGSVGISPGVIGLAVNMGDVEVAGLGAPVF